MFTLVIIAILIIGYLVLFSALNIIRARIENMPSAASAYVHAAQAIIKEMAEKKPYSPDQETQNLFVITLSHMVECMDRITSEYRILLDMLATSRHTRLEIMVQGKDYLRRIGSGYNKIFTIYQSFTRQTRNQ